MESMAHVCPLIKIKYNYFIKLCSGNINILRQINLHKIRRNMTSIAQELKKRFQVESCETYFY